MKNIKKFLTDGNELIKLLSQFHLSALEINSEYFSVDYKSKKRSGQCACALQYDGIRVGAHYIPEKDTENKIRYITSANNKIDYLLENPGRRNTFPLNNHEANFFRNAGLWGGGVRIKVYGTPLIAVGGFDPKVDEAGSISIASEFYGFNEEIGKIDFITSQMLEFQNPYVLALSVKAGLIKSLDFNESMKIGSELMNA